MPPTPDGCLKFIRDISLANHVYEPRSHTRISVTPAEKMFTEWTAPTNLPSALRTEIEMVIAGIFGSKAAEELKPERLRLCW